MSTPLEPDSTRQAVASLRGYRYQILRSVYAWLELEPGESLYLEGAEDFDVVSAAGADANQVKNIESGAALTLRAKAAREAIDNYWNLLQRNPNRRIRFNFLTTGRVGIEDGAPFGAAMAGLHLWQSIATAATETDRHQTAEQLREFLLKEGRLQSGLLAFLREASPKDLCEKLFGPVAWHTSEPSLGDVEAAILIKLRGICWSRGVAQTHAERLRDRLEREAWSVATRSSNRVLRIEEFYPLFDDVTTVNVPQQALGPLLAANQFNIAALVPHSHDFAILAGSTRVGSLPPVLGNRIMREPLERQARATLQSSSLLAVHGAIGTGKTTLVSAMLQFDASSCVWVNGRDAEPSELRVTMAAAARRIEIEPRYRYVVLDDIDMLLNERVLGESVPGLLYALRQRGGGIVITSHRPLSSRFQQQTGVETACNVAVTPFVEAEVSELLRLAGIKDEKRRNQWANIILSKTRGHPQLVAARVAVLSQANFPAPVAEDLLLTPGDMKNALEDARLVVARSLPREHKDLLYRLSVVLGAFERERAVALGKVSPELPQPGDVFDQLVGPWIERVTQSEYRLSPLLQNAGQEANGSAWATNMHGAIAATWGRYTQQTPWSVNAILVHATLGGNMPEIVRMSLGLANATEEVWQALAQTGFLFTHFYSTPGQHFPGNALEVFSARRLQLELAARSNTEIFSALLDRIDEEFPAATSDSHSKIFRQMLLHSVVQHSTVALPIERVIRVFSEVLQGFPFIAQELAAVQSRHSTQTDAADWPQAGWLTQGLGAALIQRIRTLEQVREAIPAIDAMDGAARRECLSLFREHPDLARQLADTLWLSEHESASPRWRALADALGEFASFASRWGEGPLAAGVISVQVRVLQENLDDHQSAEAVLRAGLAADPSAYLLLDAQAKVRLDTGDSQGAAQAWRVAFEIWEKDPNLNVIGLAQSMRLAAIATSRLTLWSDARNYLRRAAELALEADKHYFAAGLLADAAYSAWKAADINGAFELAQSALAELARIPNSAEDIHGYYLHKVVGHLLAWLSDHAGAKQRSPLDEPRPGTCSTLDPVETVKTLPSTPFEFSQANLVRFAQASGVGLGNCRRLIESLSSSSYAAVRMALAEALIAEALRTGEVAGFVDYVGALYAALETSRVRDRECRPLHAPDSGAELANWSLAETELDFWVLHLCRALFSRVGRGGLGDALVEQWLCQARALPAPPALVAWIERLTSLRQAGDQVLLQKMRDPDAHWADRVSVEARILATESVDPRLLLHAHSSLLSLQATTLATHLERDISRAVAAAWRAATERRFNIVAPNATIPPILEISSETIESWSKAARLFIAAAPAVGMTIPPDILAAVRRIADS